MTRRRNGGARSRRRTAVGATHATPAADAASAKGSQREPRSKPAPGLYVTATPIGNLGDVSLRALEVLGSADVIACEDTRVTSRLLRRYAIPTPLTPYHEHNAARAGPRLLRRLAEGEVVALVSDGGTPLISDPGYRLVRAAIEAGAHVTSLPGPSAATAALSIAGLPTDRFLFAGFLPPRGAARRAALGELAAVPASLVIFESPGRLSASLADMAAVLGPREAAVGRELTKRFEEVRRGRLDALAAEYAAQSPPRGEIVVVIAPPPRGGDVAPAAQADGLLVAALRDAPPARAAAEVARATGRSRRDLYARALELRETK